MHILTFVCLLFVTLCYYVNEKYTWIDFFMWEPFSPLLATPPNKGISNFQQEMCVLNVKWERVGVYRDTVSYFLFF